MLSFLASYGASLWLDKKFSFKQRKFIWGIWGLLGVIFILSSSYLACHQNKAILAASCPKPYFVEHLLQEQREQIQDTLQADADKHIKRINKICMSYKNDESKIPDEITSYLRTEIRKAEVGSGATFKMKELTSPLKGKNLYECIENYENIKVLDDNGLKITRADNALSTGVKEACKVFSNMMSDTNTSPLPTTLNSLGIFGSYVSDSTTLLDDETVKQYYTRDYDKIFN
jgi:hypothetical protein